MGMPGGFLKYTREENPWEEVPERVRGFSEFKKPLDTEERRRQGARCMNCGVPFCQSGMVLSGMMTGCPLHNLIPEWNDCVYQGNDRQALSRLLKTNNFPEFTGRVCPALCEKACVCGLNDEPVTIHDNELYIIETAYRNGWMKPRVPAVRSDCHIAVIGSGPAGLACADELNHRGHNVTVFEREDRVGGLLMYGIPNMKLDKSVIDRRVALMEKEGVIFRTGADVGRAVPASTILQRYDAIALCAGAKEPRKLQVKGVDDYPDQIQYAVDFLSAVTRQLLAVHEKTELMPVTRQVQGRHVVIIGGGDTGNDCCGTAIRLGCESVTQLEIMPQPPKERLSSNPWPEWPKVEKTDYGQQESIAIFGHDPRIYETTVKELLGHDGVLTGLRTIKMRRGSDGRLKPVEGTEEEIPCDLLLIAMGFTGCQDYVAQSFGVELGRRGTVATKEDSWASSVDKVFTAGDMHIGQSLVVRAIHEGRLCAREIDEYLMGYTGLTG